MAFSNAYNWKTDSHSTCDLSARPNISSQKVAGQGHYGSQSSYTKFVTISLWCPNKLCTWV